MLKQILENVLFLMTETGETYAWGKYVQPDKKYNQKRSESAPMKSKKSDFIRSPSPNISFLQQYMTSSTSAIFWMLLHLPCSICVLCTICS